MNAIASAMTGHHARCDDLLARVQAQASQGAWEAAADGFRRFRDELEHHLQAEEKVLFPAFEAATGTHSGPTAVMRHEHDRLRALLTQIERALTTRDADFVDGYTSTLLIMIQQHNFKEESVLYPMCDAALGDRAQELVSRLDSGHGSTCPK